MIFGFNTDVKHGDTVYHVQSEARERELVLQTQLFVSGRCVAKRATSYAEHHARPEFSTEQMHDLLRTQHKQVIELVRSGQADKVPTSDREQASGAAAADEPDPAASSKNEAPPLTLSWVNAQSVGKASDALEFDFLVAEGANAVRDARVTVRLNGSAGAPLYAQGSTGDDGHAVVSIGFDEAAHGDVVGLLVQATAQGRSVTRKFQLRRNA
jgi:C1A family cysteine protease